MMMVWFGYCLVTSGLLALAALAAERALSHFGRPVRWAWVGAAAGSIVLPFIAFFAPAALEALRGPVAVAPPLLDGLVPAVVSLGVPASSGGADVGAMLATLMVGVWVAAVIAISGYLAVSYGRLRGEMRSWVEGRILNTPVYVSRDRGPAVVGIRDAVIVLPRWIEALEERMLLMVFRHEREHQRAGDQRLLLVGLASVLFMPWNPIAWWTVRRMRLAIEFDCDQRVLASGVDPRDYAEALLHVGEHVSHPPLAAVALAENRSAIERRLRRFTAPLRRFRGVRAAVAAGVATLMVALACESPQATAPPASLGDATVRVSEQPAADAEVGDLSTQPVFTPYERPPSLENPEFVESVMAKEQARLDAAGRVELWLFVTEQGEVGNAIVKTTSGDEELDEAALRISRAFEFAPARNGEQPTPVWVSQFITFVPVERDASAGQAIYELREAPRSGEEPAAGAVVGREGQQGRFRVAPADRQAITATAATLDAIIVVDGVVQSRAPSRASIEANGRVIEEIDVMRGEEAARRYGEEARDGLVLITTKEAPSRSSRTPEGGLSLQELMEAEQPPLILIDGVIVEDRQTAELLDVDMIDRIEVLKGPAAQQAYGEQGRHGVILITTRN